MTLSAGQRIIIEYSQKHSCYSAKLEQINQHGETSPHFISSFGDTLSEALQILETALSACIIGNLVNTSEPSTGLITEDEIYDNLMVRACYVFRCELDGEDTITVGDPDHNADHEELPSKEVRALARAVAAELAMIQQRPGYHLMSDHTLL